MKAPGALVQSWYNLNPDMDKELYINLSVRWDYYSITKLQQLRRWSLGMDKYCHRILYNVCNYVSVLGLKLTPASKMKKAVLTRIYVYQYECK